MSRGLGDVYKRQAWRSTQPLKTLTAIGWFKRAFPEGARFFVFTAQKKKHSVDVAANRATSRQANRE